MTIEARLEEVRTRIAAAANRARRNPAAITLVAVSKTQPAAAVRAAYLAGQRDFGENYAQELRAKAEALADLPDLRWHFVGHLQRNKVRSLPPVSLIHAVDSARLLEALDRQGGRVLLHVNVAGEDSKSGCAPRELDALVARARACSAIELAGLMTMPPASDDPESVRPWFRALRELAARHQLGDLSMGMTGDFETAIEEGATLVRVGTAIFGAR